jgi:hypothetical protein
MKIKRFAKGIASALAFLIVIMLNRTLALASAPSGFGQFGTGILDLLNDASSFALIAGPIASGLGFAYCALRKNFADEHDYKSWNKRMGACVICCILSVGAGAIMTLATAYFGN